MTNYSHSLFAPKGSYRALQKQSSSCAEAAQLFSSLAAIQRQKLLKIGQEKVLHMCDLCLGMCARVCVYLYVFVWEVKRERER